MPKFGSSTAVVTYDDAPGGTPRTVTSYITSLGGIKLEQINEMTMPFGQNYESNTPVGVQRMPDVVVEGYFDTTATSGPHIVFGTPDDDPADTTRTFTFSPNSGTSTFTVETRLVDYEVIPSNGALTKYRATIRQAGLGAWS